MKTKHKNISTTMRVILITAAACGLASAQVIKVKNDTEPVITIPTAVTGVNSWEFDPTLQEFIVPVGQFTGLTSAGTSLNYEDLIPFKSSKIQIVSGVAGVAPTGVGTLIDANGIETNSLALLDAHTNLLSSITLFDGLLLLDGFPLGTEGPAGADGAVGPIGPQGQAGANGAVGPIGPQGSAGANGTIGPIGPQGPAGANGAIGPIGPQGPQGPAGQNLQALGNLVLDTPQANPGNVATTPGQTAINTTVSSSTTLAAGPVIWNGLAWVSPLVTNSNGVALLKGKVIIEQAQGDISMGVYQ